MLVVLATTLPLIPMTDLGPALFLLMAGLVVAFAIAPIVRRRNLRAHAADIELVLAPLGGDAAAGTTARDEGASGWTS